MNKCLVRGAIAPTLIALTALAACAPATGGPAVNQPSARPTATSAPMPITVVGDVTIVSSSAGGGGYTSTVAFHVRNPNLALTAMLVPYRVTATSQGNIVYTSDGTDTVTIGPSTTQLVVDELRSGISITTTATQPDSATVELYSAPSLFVAAAAVVLPNANQWQVANVHYTCGEYVDCVTGDLTWTGADTQQNVNVEVAVHTGSDTSGKIIAAGGYGPLFASNQPALVVAPSQTVPWTAYIDGFPQPGGGDSPAVLPSGPLTAEFAFVQPGMLTG